MNNPWTALPQDEPFILDQDKQAVFEFNRGAKAEHQLHLELLPEPYIGNPNSKVVLLSLNPGFDKGDYAFHRLNESFIKSCRNNLLHEEREYPFYLLNPNYASSPGYRWWHARLKPLIEIFGLKKVADNLCCIEYFPYHSINYKEIRSTLWSQIYNFYLVKKAVERKSMIIVTRAQKNWLERVPELNNYNFHTLNSVQNVIISSNNLKTGFSELVELIR